MLNQHGFGVIKCPSKLAHSVCSVAMRMLHLIGDAFWLFSEFWQLLASLRWSTECGMAPWCMSLRYLLRIPDGTQDTYQRNTQTCLPWYQRCMIGHANPLVMRAGQPYFANIPISWEAYCNAYQVQEKWRGQTFQNKCLPQRWTSAVLFVLRKKYIDRRTSFTLAQSDDK